MTTKAYILKWAKRYLLISASFIFLFIVVIATFDIPSFEELENPQYHFASTIYDVKGREFGRYYVEDRIKVDYDSLSPIVIKALLAVEDERFNEHSGIDFRALGRVLLKTILGRESTSGGGSTISQQLAKLLYARPSTKGMSQFKSTLQLVKSKLKEWVIAVRLERTYTKEEIISMYLNKFEFINGAHGIEAASQIYFGKHQHLLDTVQAATLVGMLKNPSLFNPKRFPQRCKERRDVVLSIMRNKNIITTHEYATFISREIDMTQFLRKTQSEDPAPHFRSEVSKLLKQILTNGNILKADGSEYNVYTDGLKIYTSLDLDIQRHAEAAVMEHMEWNQKRLWKTWDNKDPWTYQADEKQLNTRKQALVAQCKASDRYLNLRTKHLGKLINEAAVKYGNIPLSDNIVQLLDSIKNERTSWRKGIQSGIIIEENVSAYHHLINNKELWNSIIKSYMTLQKEFEIEFNTEVDMEVFDYEKGSKQVKMKPYDSVRYHRMFLQPAFVALNPITGHVKAWVGGLNHKFYKYDHVTTRRAVGSTMKPIVYTQAMSIANIPPCQEYRDIPYSITPDHAGFDLNEVWTPNNSTETFTGGNYNLYHGLLYSKNSITVKLLQELGSVDPIRDFLANAGINVDMKMPNGQLIVPKVPAISLGAVELTPLEMAGVYTTFANNGNYVQPTVITRIEDKYGRIIYQTTPKRRLVVNPLYNSIMVSMLTNNISGMFSMNVKSAIGGKTGTTDDFSDGWFIGLTPTIVMAAWVGGDDKWVRFLDLENGQGYITARPIVEKFVQRLESDKVLDYDWKAIFSKPPAGFEALTNCKKYKTHTSNEYRMQQKNEKSLKEDFSEEF